MNKPIIGLTASLEEQKMMLTRHYSDWLIEEDSIPVIIPYLINDDLLREYAQRLDGLVLTGGGDIDPTLFNEEPHPGLGPITPERDHMEIALTREMLKLNRPILAICRGCQLLNIAAGGNMFQDLSGQFMNKSLLQHDQHAPTSHASHTIDIEPDSKLYQILKTGQCKTNSFHHQAVKDPAPSFNSCAKAKDGVIEAIESTEHTFVIGVQWHPECMNKSDAISKKLFHSFVAACQI